LVVPTDWKEVRLGEICEIYQPTTIGGKDLKESGEFIVYGANGPIGRYDRFNHEESEVTVTCRGATCGTVNVTPPRVWITGNAMVVRPRAQTLSKLMLKYILQALDYSEVITGAAQPQITGAGLSPCQILVPPLKEQEVIAEALSDADAAIESLDDLIVKRRDVKQAAMQQLLTGRTRLPGFTANWEEVRLGDLGSTFGGLTGKSSKDFGEGNSRYVTFMNVMLNVVLNNQGTEKVRIGNGERQSQLLEGDVIFNGSSETPEEVGFGSAVPIELSGLYLNSFCFGFRRKDLKSLDPKFFAYLTRSPLGRDIIRPMAQGSTRYNIAKTNLLNGRFPLPPLEEQEAIAEALTVMDDELEALTEQVSKLRMVKEGMMQDLLTGKVRLV
jgi:type I restriction enzyme S subunit